MNMKVNGKTVDEAVDVLMAKDTPGVLPSEALYGFAAWLSCTDMHLMVGASHECSKLAELVDAYCKQQGFVPPRSSVYPKNLSRHETPAVREK